MSEETKGTQAEHSVVINPAVTRDEEGRVERQRLVVVVDVVPTHSSEYTLDVSIDAIPLGMISSLKHVRLPALTA